MITICLIYFRNLHLSNLEAALYSVSRQNFALVDSLVVLDNNTDDSVHDFLATLRGVQFSVPVRLHSVKHGDPNRTHAWSTNAAVKEVETPWVFFTRADYLLAFDALEKFVGQMDHGDFITGNGSHVDMPIHLCEQTTWRAVGPQVLGGVTYDYTCIDAGVWLARKEAFNQVGGLNEDLTAWGHAQTHFQWKLHQAGAVCRRVPEVLFYHPNHGGEKDLVLANQQLAAQGISLQEMWARYEGPRVY